MSLKDLEIAALSRINVETATDALRSVSAKIRAIKRGLPNKKGKELSEANKKITELEAERDKLKASQGTKAPAAKKRSNGLGGGTKDSAFEEPTETPPPSVVKRKGKKGSGFNPDAHSVFGGGKPAVKRGSRRGSGLGGK